jgi:hypothetical protein
MKFIDLLEDILNEGKNFTDEKFDRYKNNAGMWLFEVFIDNISQVATMPGYLEYKNYVLKNSNFTREYLNNLDNLVMTLPDYYAYFINEIDYKSSNKIMGKTISMFNFADKMSGRDNSAPMKRGRKPKMQDAQPEMEPQADDAMAHFDQAIEKKRRGRPSLPDDQKKRYIPTGRKPTGRPRKVVDEPTSYEDIAKSFKQTGRPEPELAVEPVMKKRGRPSKEDMANKYEPTMQPSKIKTLEDRIASLEALLREKGILAEQRTLLESKLRMMKDYRKFL